MSSNLNTCQHALLWLETLDNVVPKFTFVQKFCPNFFGEVLFGKMQES